MSGKAGISGSAPATPDGIVYKQIYWPETNVLITRFLSEDGVAEIIDYMPVGAPREDQGFHGLVRQVKVVRGRMTFRMECFPAFNYGRDPHTVGTRHGRRAFLSREAQPRARSRLPRSQKIADGVWREFTLEQQQSAQFRTAPARPISLRPDRYERSGRLPSCSTRRSNTGSAGSAKCTYKGRWREMVHRSALVLKLMTFQPTGAIVAAPTTSLPEADRRRAQLGLSLHVDSRRRLHALRAAAHRLHRRSGAFMSWIGKRAATKWKPDGRLNIMYGIDGRHDLTEEMLDHLEGYRGSSPGAHRQRRLRLNSNSISTAS